MGRGRVAAVLLAAGEGARMGGVPKCLIRIDGQTLIERHLRAMQQVAVDEVVVVTGYHHEPIEEALAPFVGSASTIRVTRNLNPARGQQSSVRMGLEALVDPAEAVLVALADQPLVGGAELGELLEAFAHRPVGTQAIYPEVNGQRGNPVVFSGALIDRMRRHGRSAARLSGGAGGGGFSLRRYLDEHPDDVCIHRTSNESFTLDLDTVEDLQALGRRMGVRIELPGAR